VREDVDNVFRDDRIQRAFRYISDHEPDIEADQIRLTMIAAPPYGEAARARQFSEELIDLRLRPVTDSIGNVIAGYDVIGRNPVIVGAHLDTVFPASTPLELQRKGRRLFLPGISDNSAGIVALLWAFRAAKEFGIRFRRPVLAIGNVGEEGEGNLAEFAICLPSRYGMAASASSSQWMVPASNESRIRHSGAGDFVYS